MFLKIGPTDAPAAAVAPGLLTFRAQQVGRPSAASPVTIFDLGSAGLTVSNVSATGDFSVQESCATVAAAGGSCPVQVTFTPTAAGTRTGTLTITDNSAGSPRTVALTGTGSSATATLAPTSLTFGMQAPNSTSAPQKVTVTNSGAIPLAISKAAATGTLTITDSAADSPQTVALTGGNAGLGLGVASGGSASATVTAGQTATYSLSIGGQGVAGTATFTCTGAPTGATCNVPGSTPFTATNASKISVSVTTTAHSALPLARFIPVTWLWAFAALGCLMAWRLASAKSSPRPRWSLVPLFAIVLCACGGGSNNGGNSADGTKAGNYTIVVTAKSGSTTQTQNLTLVVN